MHIDCVCLLDMFWEFTYWACVYTHLCGENGHNRDRPMVIIEDPWKCVQGYCWEQSWLDRKVGSAMNSSSTGRNRGGHEENTAKGLH